MNSLIKNHQTTFGLLGFILSVLIAVIYIFVTPEKSTNSESILVSALPYAHSACWVFMAMASLLFAIKAPKKLIALAGVLALACYAVFIVALFIA